MSMFSKSFKLEGVDDILSDIGYLEEKKDEGKCPDCGKEECECDDEKKSSKKKDKPKRWWDDDGDGKGWEKGEVSGSFKKEEVDFSSVLDELTDEDVLFLTDDLIEEVVEEFFYETLEEGFEIEELETLLIEHVESELAYLEEAKVTVGHDSGSEVSRPSRLAKVKDAVKKVASGAKAVAKKVAGAAGEVAGSAVAGYRKASAAAKDAPSATKSDSNDSKSDSPRTGSGSSGSSSGGSSAKGTKRPGLLGRIASGLKSGLKKAIHGAGKVAGKVVKTAKAGYDEGRGKTASASAPAKPAPKAAAKPAPKAAAKPAAKKKSGGNLDNLLKQIRSEEVEMAEAKQGPCWKGYEMVGMKNKGGREVPNCVPKEEYEELVMDMIDEGYDMDQVRQVIAAYEDGFEVIFEEDGVVINETQEVLDEEFLSDVEMVADWLHAEGIIVDEDQFFELMEDLSQEEIEELYDVVLEATAMAKRGYDETSIRNKIAKSTGGGKSADRATALEKKPTYGNDKSAKQRSDLARKQRGDFRKTTSSSPGLHGYAHKSDDPKVKAKQAARGAQRGALTPNEKKELNREGFEMIGDSLENGGLEVRNYSWREVMNMEGYQRNPEKGEKVDKKYEKVRGEKTPMPPRGDKRREDFEKWYAANVR